MTLDLHMYNTILGVMPIEYNNTLQFVKEMVEYTSLNPNTGFNMQQQNLY